MSIVLQGSTSGSITLQEPAVAGSTVLSLPATTGTVLTSASPASDLPSSIKGPAFSAYRSTTQAISANTNTKVAFNTKDFDTANCYDNTTNYRFTPNVAGYYQISAAVAASAVTLLSLGIFKNGAVNKLPFSSNSSSVATGGGSALLYLNGTTDYVEIYCQFSASLNVVAGIEYSYFQAVMVRGA